MSTDQTGLPWVAPEDNIFGVPLLDLRPLTQSWIATTSQEQQAINLTAMFHEDGERFAAQKAEGETVASRLRYRVDETLADGALFNPTCMEQKWAIFYYAGRINCVRSWTHQVVLSAEARVRDGWLEVQSVTGEGGEERLDYLLRTHALEMVWPVSLPEQMLRQEPTRSAQTAFSLYGNLALVATSYQIGGPPPERPLRTNSLLHVSIARGDTERVQELLPTVPKTLLAKDGLTLLHWALTSEMVQLLLDAGLPVDLRSDQGATALMNAVQREDPERVTLLLKAGADPDAQDLRGFTSLHRAAEMGQTEVVRQLLQAGATPGLASNEGHTAMSLAQARQHEEIAALLTRAGDRRQSS
ncbi:MAG: ankyrin repeat domain-containing protein [Candidatus Eremiobacterota bacterium]